MALVTLMERWGITATSRYGIISHLYDEYNAGAEPPDIPIPFIPDENVADRLNAYYYFGWSGDKYSSPFVEKFWAMHEVTESWQLQVAKTFWEVHGDELLRQWELFQKEYNPLESYDVHEQTDYEHSGSGSQTDSGSDFHKKTGKITSDDSSYAYDSDTLKPDSQSITQYGETGGAPMQEEIQHGKSRASSESASDDLTIHKYGNLGTVPLTKLLKDDMELWTWDFYTRYLFPAIDSMIALPIY